MWEQRAAYPLPSVELDRAQYLQQIAARGLLFGRWHGTSTASQIILQQRRWGPVSQARAHDALVEAGNDIWIEREAKIAEQRTMRLSEAYTEAIMERDANASLTGRGAFWTTLNRRERDIAAFTTDYTGQLDALRAVSRAMAGYPERIQALPDLAHPERAREQMRSRDRDRGLGE